MPGEVTVHYGNDMVISASFAPESGSLLLNAVSVHHKAVNIPLHLEEHAMLHIIDSQEEAAGGIWIASSAVC